MLYEARGRINEPRSLSLRRGRFKHNGPGRKHTPNRNRGL